MPPESPKRPKQAQNPSRRAFLLAAGAGLALPSTAFAQAPAAAPSSVATQPDGVATVHLAAQPSTIAFQPDRLTDAWTFGRRAPGPDIRLKRGEELRARLANDTPLPLSLHWQGMRAPNEQDGVAGLTGEPTLRGATADLRFTPPDSGTFIYRPLVIGNAGEQTVRGIAGVAVVEEPSPIPVDLDMVIAVDDWKLAENGQIEPFGSPLERAGSGRLGNWLTVNGARAPAQIVAPPGGRLRLRLASLCNARLMRIRFERLKAYVIAIDSQPTDTFEPLRSTLPFAPGSRYDVIVELPDTRGPAGSITALVGAGAPLVEIVTEGEPATSRRPAFPPLAPLPENPLLPPAIALQKAQRVDFVIEGGARPSSGGLAYQGDPQRIWTVNGVGGPIAGERFGKPLFSVKKGTPVVVTAVNRTAFAQVLHLHGHCARVLHPFDDGWEPYWLDTITVAEGQTVRLAFVADSKGRWLIGSGVLERLDTGLSAWFEVT